MAWSAGVDRGGAASKSGTSTSIPMNPNATLNVGEIVIVRVGHKNDSSTTQNPTNTITSVTSSPSNTWVKAGEWSFTNATIAVFISKLTSAITTGGTITGNFANAESARSIGATMFTVAAGNTYQVDGFGGDAGNESTPTPTVSGLSNTLRLWFGAASLREQTSAHTITQATDFGPADGDIYGTDGSPTNGNNLINTGWRTATLTGETWDPTWGTARPTGSIIVAIQEVSGVTVVTGAAIGRGRGRATAAALLTKFAAAIGRGRGRATAAALVQTSAAALGRGHGRSTAVGTIVVTGAAIGRSHGRATAVGTRMVLASAIGRSHGRASASALALVLSQAAGRSRGYAQATSLVQTTGAAQGFGHGYATATGDKLVPTITAAAIGRSHGYSSATGAVIVLAAAVGRSHGSAAASSTNIALGAAAGRSHGRGTAQALVFVFSAAQGRARGYATATGTVVSGAIVTGSAIGRSHGRSTASGLVLVRGAAIGRGRGRSGAGAQLLVYAQGHGRGHGYGRAASLVTTTGRAVSRGHGWARCTGGVPVAVISSTLRIWDREFIDYHASDNRIWAGANKVVEYVLDDGPSTYHRVRDSGG